MLERKNKGEKRVIQREDDNLSMTEQHFHKRFLKTDVNQVASQMKENRLIHTIFLSLKENLIERR